MEYGSIKFRTNCTEGGKNPTFLWEARYAETATRCHPEYHHTSPLRVITNTRRIPIRLSSSGVRGKTCEGMSTVWVYNREGGWMQPYRVQVWKAPVLGVLENSQNKRGLLRPFEV
ncbi:hypothetical protein BT93_B1242 [Corymbia citriodora subsp. variegata]|nr:hypothetical protein BT93_B1242 [Corymbia citriodora subsp. variegata]